MLNDFARGRQDAALLDLLRSLHRRGYAFVAPTPATHRRVLARSGSRQAGSLRDVLGWSLPFVRGTIDPEVEALLAEADMIDGEGGTSRSKVRVSLLSRHLFLHSAYPTAAPDAVFFGPDSYRFARLIEAELTARPAATGARIVDIGTGSGVGAVVAACACAAPDVRMTDINPLALRLAGVNAAAAGVAVRSFECSLLDAIEGELDLVTANPPYIMDPDRRLYRDGGGLHGGEIALDMTRAALDRLAPGGRLILYTGSAIVAGDDALRREIAREAEARDMTLRYDELDPDVFGEELEKPAYRDVERIALVSAVVTRPA